MKALLSAALTLAASPAIAQFEQPMTGTLTRSKTISSTTYSAMSPKDGDLPILMSNGAALQKARTMVSCAVKKNGVDALNVVEMSGGDTAFRRFSKSFEMCMPVGGAAGEGVENKLRSGADTVMPLVAEAYFLRFGPARLTPLALKELRAKPYWAESPPITRVALCLTGTNPAEVAQLLGTIVGSQGEAAAMSALVPKVGGCVDQGVKVSLSRDVLRLNLAQASVLRAREIPGAFPPPNRK